MFYDILQYFKTYCNLHFNIFNEDSVIFHLISLTLGLIYMRNNFNQQDTHDLEYVGHNILFRSSSVLKKTLVFTTLKIKMLLFCNSSLRGPCWPCHFSSCISNHYMLVNTNCFFMCTSAAKCLVTRMLLFKNSLHYLWDICYKVLSAELYMAVKFSPADNPSLPWTPECRVLHGPAPNNRRTADLW